MKKFIVLIIVIAIASAAFYMLSTINKPSTSILSKQQKEEAVEKLLGRKPVFTVTPQTTWIQYNGKYIRFSYPQWAQVVPEDTQTPGSATLESFAFTITDPRTNCGAQIIKTQHLASVEEIPGVTLRRNQPRTYIELPIPNFDMQKGVGFVKADTEYEKTAFYLSGDIEYTFSCYGADKDEVEMLFARVISSAKKA